MSRRRIQMTDRTQFDETASPCLGELARAIDSRQRIVAACRDDARKRQRLTRNRQPSVFAQCVDGRIAGGHGRFEIRRRGEQCAANHRRIMPARPVREHHHARAVRDDDHRTFDRFHRARDCHDARGAAELVVLERRDAVHARQLRGEQGLPMVRNVVTQSRNDKNGVRFSHVWGQPKEFEMPFEFESGGLSALDDECHGVIHPRQLF